MEKQERLAFLPDVESLRKLSQSLAMLDAILSPEWEARYYSFNSKWDTDEMMASMRNGEGDEYYVLFNKDGAIIKGFAHESPMSPFSNKPVKIWKGVLEDVPKEFQSFLSEPAFALEETTFCIWRKYIDSSWQIGNINYPTGEDPDGLMELLFILDSNPSTYKDFAEEYYEQEVPLSSIESIYQHKPLTKTLVKTLNEEVSVEDLQEDIQEIGYRV